MNLYHITSKKNAKKIAIEGFKPLIGKNSMALGEPHPAIYFFPSMEDAEEGLSNWLGELFEENEEIKLITVNGSGLALHSVISFEVFSLEPVSKDRIISIQDI